MDRAELNGAFERLKDAITADVEPLIDRAANGDTSALAEFDVVMTRWEDKLRWLADRFEEVGGDPAKISEVRRMLGR